MLWTMCLVAASYKFNKQLDSSWFAPVSQVKPNTGRASLSVNTHVHTHCPWSSAHSLTCWTLCVCCCCPNVGHVKSCELRATVDSFFGSFLVFGLMWTLPFVFGTCCFFPSAWLMVDVAQGLTGLLHYLRNKNKQEEQLCVFWVKTWLCVIMGYCCGEALIISCVSSLL